MIEIIMHEREWAESALANPSLGAKPMTTLNRIAKYYNAQGYTKAKIHGLLEDYVLRCDPHANIVKWQELIDHVTRRCDRYPLIDIPYVGITQKELDSIAAVDSVLARRFMFALLCLSKYAIALNPECNGWVTREAKDIFALANVNITIKRQGLLINDLWRAGYIAYSKVIDNLSLQVLIVDTVGEPVVKITDFRNLGNQYSSMTGAGSFIKCHNCELTIRKTAYNKKYCPACALEVNRQNSRAAAANARAA